MRVPTATDAANAVQYVCNNARPLGRIAAGIILANHLWNEKIGPSPLGWAERQVEHYAGGYEVVGKIVLLSFLALDAVYENTCRMLGREVTTKPKVL